MIKVEDLCFDYPGKRALDHLSFSIAPQTITGLVGPNGAGKTTLLRCLSALETPMQGKISINGWDVDREPRKIHEIGSYLADFFGLYDNLTVAQNLTFFGLSHSLSEIATQQSVTQVAKQLEIQDYLQVTAGKLSRGLRQRLAIAQTIIHQPKILFLDEPASGLDPQSRFHLSKLLISLQKSGMTLIVSSHILSELEDYCTHMLVMDQGKMVKHCAINDASSSEEGHVFLDIEFTLPAEEFAPILNTIPNILIKSIHENHAMVDFKGNIADKHTLLKLLLTKNLPVSGVTERKQSMQDVYLNIANPKKTTAED